MSDDIGQAQFQHWKHYCGALDRVSNEHQRRVASAIRQGDRAAIQQSWATLREDMERIQQEYYPERAE